MVRGDPRPAPYERHLQPQGPEIKTEITDFNFTEQSAADEALVNRRYASSTWKTGLQPEDSATYACRWIHLRIRHSTFHEFMTIVHDLLSDYGSDERNKILSKLRKLQRRNEVMGSHGPNFRPAFTALYGTDKHDTTRGSVEPHRPIDLPAFVSIPTIHFHESSRGSFPKRSHRAKSLLQYYYRHGISDDADLESPFDPSTIFSGPRIPQVRELWCLAVDKKNLISVSFLGASAIWPFAGQESQSSSLLPPTALFAINEYFQEEQENIPARLQKAASLKQMTVIIRLGLVGLLVSFFVPGGWMLDRLSQSFQKRTFGINSSEISRLYSFISTLCRGLEIDTPTIFKMVETFFEPVLMRRYEGEAVKEILKLPQHMKYWVEVERMLRTQGEASDEASQSLRALWSIAIHFAVNFYLAPDGKIYQLGRRSIWSSIFRRFLHISGYRKGTSINNRVSYRPGKHGRADETLQELENQLATAITDLNLDLRINESERQAASGDDWNANMLRDIQRFKGNLSLACIFWLYI